jgi:uncharacterized RDD family membrane protein YckC
MENEKYPRLLDRVKAILTDAVVIILFMIIFTNIFALFNNVPDQLRMMAFVFIFFLYDPLFTSIFGGTIGHMMIGLRVKRESNERKNILFHLAFLRFIVKASLGIVSLVTLSVSGNTKRKAIHDYLVGSVVLYA